MASSVLVVAVVVLGDVGGDADFTRDCRLSAASWSERGASALVPLFDEDLLLLLSAELVVSEDTDDLKSSPLLLSVLWLPDALFFLGGNPSPTGASSSSELARSELILSSLSKLKPKDVFPMLTRAELSELPPLLEPLELNPLLTPASRSSDGGVRLHADLLSVSCSASSSAPSLLALLLLLDDCMAKNVSFTYATGSDVDLSLSNGQRKGRKANQEARLMEMSEVGCRT